MESNKVTNIVLVIIGLLLAGILIALLTANKYRSYEGAFDNIPPAEYPAQTQGINQQGTQQPSQNPNQGTVPNQPASTGSVTLDMSSEYAQTYKTLFTTELTKPANFAGHYRVVEVGCGSGCTHFYVLDKNTGKVMKVPTQYMDADEGGPKEVTNFYYSADSGVLVISTTTFQYRYQLVNGQFQLVSTQ